MTMTDKEVVITGATAGIGEAAAEALARMGANVTFVARSREKAETLATRLRTLGSGRVRFHIGDLGELSDVRRVAAEIRSTHTRIDVLVNNAGVVNTTRTVTRDGFEQTFALNHLSYFLLTHLLLDLVKASPSGRIINTASDAHLMIDDMVWDDLSLARSFPQRGWKAYCQSKLGNVMFTFALARRLAGTNVRVNAIHPGFVRTGLGKNNGTFAKLFVPFVALFGARSPERGADTIVWLASADEAVLHGEYLYDRKPHRRSRAARDVSKQERLYEVTASLVGISE